MQEHYSCDAAVVGAGPAGSLCAARLAELGYHVLLLDENPGTRQKIICTGITGAEAFARFSLPGSVILSAISKARFISPGGFVLGYETPEPFAYVVDRHRLDGALQRKAVEQGAEICFGVRAGGVKRLSGGIRLHCSLPDAPLQIDARIAVFATGFNQRVARLLELGEPERLIQGVQVEVLVRDLAEAEVYFGKRIAPGFFAWVVPIGRGRARVGLLAPREGRRYLEQFLSQVLRDRVHESPSRITARLIVQGALPRTAGNHFLVVGEAAGQVKTSTAGGIYYGLLCAELAAEVIDRAFKKGDLSEKSLALYQRRWERLLGPELRAGFQLQRLGAAMSDPEIDHVFQVIGSNGILSELQRQIKFDWHRLSILFLLRHPGVAGLLRKVLHRNYI